MNPTRYSNKKISLPFSPILLSFLCFLTAHAQHPTVDPKYHDVLKWAITGKGKKHANISPQIQQISSGVYNPKFSGSPETPKQYFKNWYAPYEKWNAEMQLNSFRQSQSLKKDIETSRLTPAASSQWMQKGPYGMKVLNSSPTVYFSGRVTAVGFSQSSGVYLGAATGGLWGRGSGFLIYPLSDQLPSLSIGGFALHPTHPDTIILGTGEYQEKEGTGVYRTFDGGAHWQLVLNTYNVSKVLIAPWNSSTVFVTSNTGLYKSTDNGDNWTKVGIFDWSDIASAPDGSYLLAGFERAGVYRSKDFGDTWDWLPTGLPSRNVGRVSVAISSSNPNRAYVQIARIDSGQVLGVYRTDNALASTPTWTSITPTGNLKGYMDYGWYANVIAIHPDNPDIVWLGSTMLLRSSDGGSNWMEVGTNTGQVHVDIHALVYRPSENSFFVGCDGGIFFTFDEGANWTSTLNLILPITQFYNIDIAKSDDRVKYGASQDNGIEGTSVGDSWVYSEGGDGIDVAVDRSNASIVYGTDGYWDPKPRWRRRKTVNSGMNWDFINTGINEDTPWGTIFLVQDPTVAHSQWLYSNAGGFVYFSTNAGSQWTRMDQNVLGNYVINVSVNSNGTFIYAPTFNYPLQSLIGYRYSANVNPPWFVYNLSLGLPKQIVKRVVTSVSDSSRAYALMNGIGGNQKIFKTTDNGKDWTNITGDLPDVPVNALLESPGNQNVLWLGTDQGAYKTKNGGGNWGRWNYGMPEAAIITDMKYVFSDSGDYILAGTYGRSTFERSVVTQQPQFVYTPPNVNFGVTTVGKLRTVPLNISNLGDAPLNISSVEITSPYFTVYPTSGTIAPGDSLMFSVNFYPFDSSGRFSSEIIFTHDADGSPTHVGVLGYAGDTTMFRTFKPESLIVKKEVKRKIASTSWCFNFTNANQFRDPASLLHVEFKNKVMTLTGYQPFAQADNPDGKGKLWIFSNGGVSFGTSSFIYGRTKKTTRQEVKKWWWESNGGILGDIQGIKLPIAQSSGLDMPNAANFRKEIFQQIPITGTAPLIVGVADPLAKTKRIAYVSFSRDGSLLGSLMPGRSGKQHDGPPRCFRYFDNGKEMIGVIKKLTPDMQSNHLFSELVALKLNILGSALGKTPVGFGELKYNDPGNPLNAKMIKQIDSLADIYMTYCDSSGVGSGVILDTVIHRINCAFVGPLDTISFATKLRFAGVRSISQVPFLLRSPSIAPTILSPNLNVNEVPDAYALFQNYPNPFNPTTTIQFSLPRPAAVTLTIFNLLGQEITTILDHEKMDDGVHEVEFDGSNLSSGVYFYRMAANALNDGDEETAGETFIAVKKMLLIR